MRFLLNTYPENHPKSKTHPSGGIKIQTNIFWNFLIENKEVPIGLTIIPKKEGTRLDIEKTKKYERASLVLGQTMSGIFTSDSTNMYSNVRPAVELIKNAVSKLKPDFAFVNGITFVNWVLCQALKELGIPMVALHAGILINEMRAYSHKPFSRSQLAMMKKLGNDFSKFTPHEIFYNHTSLNEYKRLYPHYHNKPQVIPLPYNTVFLKQARPLALSKTKALKVGMVGRWDSIKRHDIVLKLAKLAKKQGRTIEFYAVTAFSETSTWVHTIHSEYPKYVNVLSPMPPQKLARFYASMDILILPSDFDVSPTVVMEAALQGRGTIITPRVGWADLYKKKGLQRYVTDFKNIHKTLDLIETLGRKKLPATFTKYLAKYHHPSQIYKQYLTLARSILKEQSSYENRATRS